jgi:hypothetical protein
MARDAAYFPEIKTKARCLALDPLDALLAGKETNLLPRFSVDSAVLCRVILSKVLERGVVYEQDDSKPTASAPE